MSGTARIGFNHTDLAGWDIKVEGGSEAGKGSVRPGSALLEEGDSFTVELERSFVVPERPAPLRFTYSELSFDTSDADSINDAFEAALVGPDGKPLVHTHADRRDSFFNVTEEVGAALGPQTTETGGAVRTVTVNLADVPAGTAATVRFRLVNNDQDTGTSVRILDVFVPTDTAPTAAVTGDTAGVPGQGRAFAVSATDPSPEDQAAGFTFNVAWGDGTSTTVRPGQPQLLSHAYAEPGTYTVSVTATDRTGAVSDPATHEIVIALVAIQPDVCDPDKTVLAVGGTPGPDTILFQRVGTTGQVRVTVNGTVYGPFAPTGRLFAFGQGGDDTISTGNVPLPSWLYGQDGNDSLTGGNQSDILLGGDGNDLLVGLAGRDLFVAGRGTDATEGGAGDELLIDGTTKFDATPGALCGIQKEWTSARGFVQRVKNLRGEPNTTFGDRLNGLTFLTAGLGATVFADTSPDRLHGQDGNCWYLADLEAGPTRDATDFGNIDIAEDVDPAGGVRTGPVAAFDFDTAGTTLIDVSGHGNDGTIAGATWSASGHTGGAMSFDGIDDWVTIPDAAGLDLTTGMTLEAWVKPTGTPAGWQTVLLKEEPAPSTGLAYALYANDPTNNRPAAYVNTGGSDQSAAGTARLGVDAWAHLAATYDGLTLRMYVNGVEVRSKPVANVLMQTDGALRLGGNAVWGEFFKGLIDDVRVYDRALSAGEIGRDKETPAGQTGAGTKFFVVDVASDAAFRYGASGTGTGAFGLGGGSADVRGVASNAAGDTLWTIDGTTKLVTVQGPDGTVRGSWTPLGLVSPQDLATDGTDVWVVDAGTKQVVRYAGVSRTFAGTVPAAGAFALHAANASPSGLATDGHLLWVTDEAAAEVFVYTAAGTLLGRWKLDPANTRPSGVTLDPTGASLDLWVVDRLGKTVYRYAGARAWVDGTRTAADSFALAAGNGQPEGIADPLPGGESLVVTASAGSSRYPAGETVLISGRATSRGVLPGPDPGPITFEVVPGGAVADGMTISNQFTATHGVTFRLENGQAPLIAQVGAPQTAFVGPTAPDTPAPGQNVGSFFLTDDGLIDATSPPPSPLIITYERPVAGASGTILDMEETSLGYEAWRIEARGETGIVIETVNLDLGSPNAGDGLATLWSFSHSTPDIHSIRIVYTGTRPTGVGLAFDNFSPASSLPIMADRSIAGVRINGAPVAVLDVAGHFFARADVKPGVNRFEVIATDAAGVTGATTVILEGHNSPPESTDFSLLFDVSAGFRPEYSRTSFDTSAATLYAGLAIRNTGQYPADSPLLVGVANLSDPTVRLMGADGRFPDGTPYYDLSAQVPGGSLAPGAVTDLRELSFFNPNRVQFTYDLVVRAKLNRAPAVTSIPDVEALVGRLYAPTVTAADPDGDTITFSLVAGPNRLTIDPTTGRMEWAPTAADVGTHAVAVRVEDGRGGSAEQRFALATIEPPPNRPPTYISTPVVAARVGAEYVYDVDATDPDGDALTYSVLMGPTGLEIDGQTGVVRWEEPGIDARPPGTTWTGLGSNGHYYAATNTTMTWEEANALAGQMGGHLVSITSQAESDFLRQTFYPTATEAFWIGLTDREQEGTFRWTSVEPVTFTSWGTGEPNNAQTGVAAGTGEDYVAANWQLTNGLGQPGRWNDTPNRGTTHLGTAFQPYRAIIEFDQFPTANVALAATDGRGGVAMQAFTIGVEPAADNHTPVIVSAAMTTASPGKPYSYDVDALDPDEDSLAYSLTRAPAGMTIDPSSGQVVWGVPKPGEFGFGVRFGSSGAEAGRDVATDPAGNAVVAGLFAGTVDFDPGPGVFNLTSPGGPDTFDGFVAKYAPDGSLIWARSMSGASTGWASAVATDASGNVYVTGDYFGSVDFDPGPGVFNLTETGGGDVYVLKLDPAGNFAWAVSMGAPSNEETGYAITTDGAGDVYVTGRFYHTVDFDPGPGTFNLASSGGADIFALKLRADGRFDWARAVGSSGFGPGGDDVGYAVAVDSAGGVYVAGIFQQTVDFDPGPGTFPLSSAGSSDSFVLKLDPAGNFAWARRFGNSGGDQGLGVVVDDAGHATVAGLFLGSVDFDPGPGVVNLTSAGDYDGFLVTLDGTGGFVRALRVGGAGLDDARDLTIDSAGDIYLTGWFQVSADFDPGPGVATRTSAGGLDGFVLKLDRGGTFEWVRSMGGPGTEQSWGVAADAFGNVYTTGSFAGVADFDPGPGVANLSSAGGIDVFVSRLTQAPQVPEVTVRVEDGRGGFDTQSFTIDVRTDQPGEIRGTKFNDLDGDGLWGAGQFLVTNHGNYPLPTSPAAHSVFRYDSATGAFTDVFVSPASGGLQFPHALAFGPDGNLYVGGHTGVLRYNGATGAFLSVITISTNLIGDVAFAPDGDLYVSDYFSNAVRRYDGVTGAFKMVVAAGGALSGPDGIAFGPDGNLYVVSQNNNRVLRYNRSTGTLIDIFIPTGSGGLSAPTDLVFAPDGNVLVTSNGTNSVLRFSAATGAFLGSFVPTGGGGLVGGTALTLGPDGGVYVSTSDGVLRYSGTTGAFIDVFIPASSTGLELPHRIVFTPGSEPGLSNSIIYIDANANSRRDLGERFTTTDAFGNYSFPDLAPGTYVVAEEPQAGWVQTAPPGGTHTVTVAAGQTVVGKDFGNRELTEPPTNHPPAFTSIAPTTATAGQLLRYDATAADPDRDSISFDLVVKPEGMAVGTSSGIVVWTPKPDQVGSHEVVLRLQDTRGGVALQAFTVTVAAANTVPVISSLPTGPAVANHPWHYQVAAQDADGDPLAYLLDAGPLHMEIDAAGMVTWTPTADQVGTHHVAVTVSDGRGGEATQTFDLPAVATAPDAPPAISSAPRTSTRIGDPYLYQVVATDPNADPLSYSLPIAPAGMEIDAAGLVDWTPFGELAGPHPVQVRVEDGRGGFATQTWTLAVVAQATNAPPAITSSPSASATVGRPYAYDLAATDPDGDPIAWSLDVAPGRASLHPVLGTFRWTPTADQLGPQTVVGRAVDGRGGFATQTFVVTVRAVNVPPGISSAPPTTAVPGQPYTYAVRAADVDGDLLTFALPTAPGNMQIDAATGLVRWIPPTAGTFAVGIQVADGQGGFATQTYSLVVAPVPVDRPPVVTSTPSLVATVGQPYAHTVTATDPDGTAVVYSLPVRPAGMEFNAATGLIQWTPTDTQVGPHPVTVVAADTAGNVGSQTFTIVVAAINQAPTVTSGPVQTVTAGLPYRYDVRATDPDGDPLNYTLDRAPAWLSIDSLGRLIGSPGIPDIGVHRIEVTVADSRGAAITQAFDLAVLADTQAPRLNLFVSGNPVNVGTTVFFLVPATDNVGVASLSLTVGGVAVPLDAAGRGSLLVTAAGDLAIVARATDAAGLVSTASGVLTVIDPSDTSPPEVDITSPLDGAVIRSPVDVTGTAADATLTSYVLEAVPAAGGPAVETFRGTTSVTNGVLGRFDPTGLANDSYILRLSATDAGGNVSTIETAVEVAGDLKVGNFTLSFTDLTVPVSGVPITVTRTYDTLQGGRDEGLGFGWRLEFRDTDLRTSLPPTGQEEYGVYNPFRDGTRVYVTVPGGRREGFTFQPRRSSGFGGLFFSSPEFVADPGVTSRLSVPDNVSLIWVNGAYHALNQLPYNPADNVNFAGTYTLTTKDGLAYSIDAVTGDLRTVGDVNGNTLTFTDTSVTSSAGPRVTFGRDPAGRITSVTDPAGNRVRYAYDLRGDLVAVTDREENTTRFEYLDPARPHFLTKVFDPLGRPGVRTEYDEQGRLARLLDAAGRPTVLTYDPTNSLQTVTDALGHPTTFVYDDRGNVLTEIDAAGGRTERTYDLANNLLTETNANDETRTYTYDGDGNVLTETDPLGNITRHTYRTFVAGLFAQIRGARPVTVPATTTDPLGHTTKFEYDGAGNLMATTDAAGHITRNTYDGAGNLRTTTDPDGGVTAFDYDAVGRLVRQTDALGHATVFTHDANGNQLTQTTTLTTPAGVRTLLTRTDYDASGRPIAVYDAEGYRTRTEYDDLGRQAAVFDALERPTRFIYDDRGQLIETVFFDGTHTTADFDAVGRRVAATDRAGRQTRFEYDTVGRLVTTIFPDATPLDPDDNPRTRTEYDPAGQVIGQVNERGVRTAFEYDPAGRQVLVRDILGHETTTGYDIAGRAVTSTDPLGHTTRFNYDALGRVESTVFADGTRTSKEFDALGRVRGEFDQLGRTTAFDYDPLGRLKAVVDALAQRTEYAYDEAGNLVRQTDASLHSTQYEYDGLGRRIATVLPLGQRSTAAYDPLGNLAATTDFNTRTVTYDYDSNNRLTARRFPDGTAVLFTYTPTGQRATETDARGTTIYVHDERDRLVSRTEPDGTRIGYTYDAAGNRTAVTTPAGTTAYTFDPLNRTATVTDPALGETEYTYDAAGNPTRTDFPNGTSETREYDPLNRLTFVANTGPAGVVASSRYTLGPTGRRDAVVEQDGRRVDYTYDPLDRLTEEKITDVAAGNRTIGYTYDPVGNRRTRTDTAEGTTTSTYDINDRLLTDALGGATTAYTYDDNGNTLTKTTSPTDRSVYVWDVQNRLVRADVTDASGTKRMDYRYDADGIRVSSAVAGSETRYLIDGVQPYAQVAVEYLPGGIVLASYVHGNDLVSQLRGGARSYYHVDGLGSTRALTNAAGLVTDRYVYDAFGRTILRVGTTENAYQFAGEQRDGNVGLDYLRARYLNVGTGRFYAMDPFEGQRTMPATLHRFTYVNGNPANSTDPSGQITLTDLTPVFAAMNYDVFVSGSTVRFPQFGLSSITLSLDVILLSGATDTVYSDITETNNVLRDNDCGLRVAVSRTYTASHSVTSAILGADGGLEVGNPPSGLSAEEGALVQQQQRVTAYYIPAFADNSYRARAMAQTPHGVNAIVMGPGAPANTFAHELGHVLLGDGNHHPDSDNVMFRRPGWHLTQSQAEAFVRAARELL